MAFHDDKGRITIDEQAAAQDIRRLREAADILKESREAIRSLQRQSGDMQGKAASAIQAKGQEMEKELARMIEKLENSADFIRKTVEHYRRLDEELKRAIQAAAHAASSAAAFAQSASQVGSGAAAGVHTVGAAVSQGGQTGGGQTNSALAGQIGGSVMDALKRMGDLASAERPRN